jgi:hypothetical protein
VTAELDIDGVKFFDTVGVDIPRAATVMEVSAKFASTDQTIVRNRSTSRSQASTDATAEKLSVSLGTGEKISKAFNFGFVFDETDTISDTDTTAGGTSTTVTEVIKVPTGALDIAVVFKN